MSFSKDYLYPFKELMAIMRRLDRPLYMIASETEVSDPKCPYCDENRMITLTAPNGQSMTVPCKCGENKHKVYYVIPCRTLGLKIDEMSVELRYDYGTRKYVRRHDSIVDPETDDKRLKSTNYISLSFTTIEKAVAFIERQGWIYSKEHTEEAMRKAERGIAVRSGLHCAPLAHQTTGTIETGTVRVSFSAFNTEEEVFRFLETLADILQGKS